jgi:hypothetical protein
MMNTLIQIIRDAEAAGGGHPSGDPFLYGIAQIAKRALRQS